MGPLAGIRVLDLGQFISAPYTGVLLAEMGAEVLKVEPPTGDPFRTWEGEGFGPSFAAFNRGKRSLVLDLKTPRDRERLLHLAETADVFLENFRPGVTARLGIDYETLKSANPRLVYCTVTGFGPDGPYVDRPSYDSVAQGLSGLTGLFLDPEQPRLRGPASADSLTGLTAAFAITTALVASKQTGRGQHVEVNMLHSLVHFLGYVVAKHVMGGIEPGPDTHARSAQAYVFRAADGKPFLIHLSSPPKFWQHLCEAIGRSDLLTDPRFATRKERVRRYEELAEELQRVFETRSRQEWLEVLVAHEVPCAPANRISEVVQDPQVQHLGIVDVEEDPSLGPIPRFRPPARFSEDTPPVLARPPLLGEHTREILDELGSRV
ncbi:MAG: CoA transferase [Chloroflexi bacterium]|nr:CoA transferase [Chloroflexota bacterium]